MRSPVSVSRGRWRRFLALSVALGASAAAGQAEGPVPHVHFDPDPADDLRWGARAARGRLPAALDTPSGLVPAPGEAHSSSVVYGGAAGQGVDAAYRIDRLTTQPDVVRYDDPFSPSVAPFKRLFAFDRVGEGLELTVGATQLEKVSSGGSVQAGEDAFFGDLQVDLVAGTPVRIPSVAPGARLLVLHADPAEKVEIWRDGADNWFALAERSGRVRLLMQLSVPRAVFQSKLRTVGWSELSPYVAPPPAGVRAAADRVLTHLDVSQALEPAQALSRLVAYFRGFAPSADLPRASSTAGLYEELALSRKGVCRHRSYAFVITAHQLGLPARFVHNEAHAWVEVFDGRIWRRVDLGGAAGRMEYERPPEVPLHRPPQDDFPWPAQANPGAAAPGVRPPVGALGQVGPLPPNQPDGRDTPIGTEPPSGAQTGSANSGIRGSSSDVTPTRAGHELLQAAPRSEVSLELGNAEIRRGHPLRVMGRLKGQGTDCGFGRVDFALRTAEGKTIPLGSLPTDARGAYAGEVVVPLDVPVGEHEVEATSPGAPACGPSR